MVVVDQVFWVGVRGLGKADLGQEGGQELPSNGFRVLAWGGGGVWGEWWWWW